MDTEQHLYDEFKVWCRKNRMPHLSADELILRDDITFRQRTYLMRFIERWHAVLNPWRHR